ncbi:anti-repressor SinI family protein [Rossellomorea marisflavi]|jgi:uncharacterized short protein YbdD (DUF466 family)
MTSKTPLEEWFELIMEAKEVGISIDDVRNYIQQMRNNNK